MKRLILFPTGRQIWFKLACHLEDHGIGTPVIWLGDDCHLKQAQSRFVNSQVLSLKGLLNGDIPSLGHHDALLASKIIESSSWPLAHKQALKLIDRYKYSDAITLREREVHLMRLLTWASSTLLRAKPDALIMAESPHTAPQLIVYTVAVFLKIPVYSFVSWPIVPGMVFQRNSEPLESGSFNIAGLAAVKVQFKEEIDRYLSRFWDPGYSFEPRYMKIQANREESQVPSWLNRWPRRLKLYSAIFRPSRVKAALLRHKLRVALSCAIKSMPSAPYVYFPLHYEPERTTNPDGGRFHDQLSTLIQLRAIVPSSIPIVVREHPSIFNAFMHGHIGRHPLFYSALCDIQGVHLVPMSINSADLLRGCLAVATITGTAALEAAVLGKPALAFGKAWYADCPSITQYSNDFDWQKFVDQPSDGLPSLRPWIYSCLNQYLLPGSANPSNERYFKSWYSTASFADVEFNSIFNVLRTALI